MAKYNPSALIGRISRSAGCTTFGHNRVGSYFRNRVMPTNPASTKQALVRGSLGTLASNWRGLTEVQRGDWTGLGLNMIRTDSLGITYDLTGEQAYIAINRNLFTYGGAYVTAAPVYSPPAALLTITPTATAGTPTLSVAYTATPLAAGVKLAIFATRQLSAGIYFQPRGAYKQVLVTAAAAASPANILSAYTAIFGALVAGKKILLRAVPISSTGVAGVPSQSSLIIGA